MNLKEILKKINQKRQLTKELNMMRELYKISPSMGQEINFIKNHYTNEKINQKY